MSFIDQAQQRCVQIVQISVDSISRRDCIIGACHFVESQTAACGICNRNRLANRPCRFDVVSIHFDSGQPVIELFQNAFDSSSF